MLSLISNNLNKIHEHGLPATKTFSDGRLAIKTELPVARRKRERLKNPGETADKKMRRNADCIMQRKPEPTARPIVE